MIKPEDISDVVVDPEQAKKKRRRD